MATFRSATGFEPANPTLTAGAFPLKSTRKVELASFPPYKFDSHFTEFTLREKSYFRSMLSNNTNYTVMAQLVSSAPSGVRTPDPKLNIRHHVSMTTLAV